MGKVGGGGILEPERGLDVEGGEGRVGGGRGSTGGRGEGE